MKTIEVYVSTGYVGAEKTKTFEIEDDATDEEIEGMALEVMWEMIEFNYKEL